MRTPTSHDGDPARAGTAREGTLHVLGEHDWPELIARTDGWEAGWTDLDGLHLGRLPSEAPPTSHLWAWDDEGSALRVRLDGTRWVGAVLVPHGRELPSSLAELSQRTEAVLHTSTTSHPWADDERIPPTVGSVRHRAWILLTTLDDAPITFVRPA